MRMIHNLSAMGHNQNEGGKGNVLELGFESDILATFDAFMNSGLMDIATCNFKGIFRAFDQLNLVPLTLDGVFPLSMLGTLAPPLPHLGVINRTARNSRIWIK